MFRGETKETEGTAFVVYEDVFNAKRACERLNGLKVQEKYLEVQFCQLKKKPARRLGWKPGAAGPIEGSK